MIEVDERSQLRNLFIFAAAMVFGLGVLAFFQFTQKNHSQMELVNEVYIKEIAMQARQTLRLKLREALTSAENMALLFSHYERDTLADKLKFSNFVAGKGTVAQIDYVDIAKETVSAATTENLWETRCLQAIARGESGISDAFESNSLHKKVFVVYAPVKKNDDVVGGIKITYDIEALTDAMEMTSFQQQGFFHVVKSDGEPVVCSNHQKSFYTGRNIFAELAAAETENVDSLDKMKGDMANRRSGAFYYALRDQRRMLYYTPMEINNWYIVSITPEKIVKETAELLDETALQFLLKISSLFAVIIVIIVFFAKKANDKINLSNKKLNIITEITPGGMKKCRADARYTIVYCNRGYLKLCGCSHQELASVFGNSLLQIIHSEDRKRIKQEAEGHMRRLGQSTQEFQYRMITKTGETKWVLDRANLVEENGQYFYYSMVIDITAAKHAERALVLSNQKYELAIAHINGTIMECDLLRNILYLPENYAQKCCMPTVVENMPEGLIETSIIMPEFVDNIVDLYRSIKEGARAVTTVIKSRFGDGPEEWRRIKVTVIVENNQPIWAIITVEDITEQVDKEQSLKEQAEQDCLTNLYNKVTTEKKIKEILLQDERQEAYALMMLDLDDFKYVNDTFGHMIGDIVLNEVAAQIKVIFDNSAIIGRVGGDEYMIFLPIHDLTEDVEERAETLIQKIRQVKLENIDALNISASIGIAVAPQDGTTFAELYEKADIALYQAKHAGRSCYKFCREDQSRQ